MTSGEIRAAVDGVLCDGTASSPITDSGLIECNQSGTEFTMWCETKCEDFRPHSVRLFRSQQLVSLDATLKQCTLLVCLKKDVITVQRVATKGLSCHSSVSGQKPAPKGSSSSSSSSPKAQYDHSNETLEKASLAF